MHRKLLPLLVSSTLLSACGSKESENEESGQAETTGEGTGSTTSDTDSMSSTFPSSGPQESSGEESSETGVPFITDPDGASPVVECDVWAEDDCGPDEKCMPWANDGGNSWNATRCSPLDPNPSQIGDACTVEGSGVSGIDNCENRSMCYYVNPETNEGLCVGFCEGQQANPTCGDGFVCTIVNDGVLTLCRPECDPTLQDCQAENVACLPASGSDRFTCIIDASGETGNEGDPCEFINSCSQGLYCATAEVVPGCDQSMGCCSFFCDLTDTNPDDACNTGGGQMCLPWYADGEAPPDYAHVGGCGIPVG